jgi:hypothetical protein
MPNMKKGCEDMSHISNKEAELVAMLTFKPFTIKTVSSIWKMDEVQS